MSEAQPSTHHNQPSLDEGLAQRAAEERLQAEFGDMFGEETIDRFLEAAYAQFAHHASVPNFVPLLAERFTRQRLQALARVENKHHDGKPVVLFLCPDNAGRSQIATALFSRLAGENAVAWSGGRQPSDEVNPVVFQVISECGIDLSHEYPKPWTDEIVQAADVVVTMGCAADCPVFPGRRYEEWAVEDPDGHDAEEVRAIRDEIERRLRRLLDEFEIPARA